MTRTVIGGPSALRARVQLGQVAAVGQHRDRGQPERRRGPPQDVRPGGQHVAGQGVAQEVAVGQHQHLRAERAPAGPGPGSARRRCRGRAWPRSAPRSPTPPRPSSGPAGTPHPGWHSRAARSTRRSPSSRARRWWSRPSTPPAARSRTPPPRPRAPTGPATCSNSMCNGSAPNRVRARDSEEMFGGRHRRPVTGLDPAVRVEDPVQQLLAAAAVIQRVHQLDHHPPVAAVRAPEQPQRQHEIDHQPSGQQPATQLPGVGGGHHPIHQLRRERPGQRPHRHPVGQPPLRRDPRRPVMRHTVIIPRDDHQSAHLTPACRDLTQGHWVDRYCRTFDAWGAEQDHPRQRLSRALARVEVRRALEVRPRVTPQDRDDWQHRRKSSNGSATTPSLRSTSSASGATTA